MDSSSQALANAAATLHWTVGMCDNFVAKMYGYTNSGYDSAAMHWASLPSQDKHPGDMNAPAGALMFWGGGYGHVAISDGKGGIYSTDIPNSGDVSHVSASYVTNVWRKPYLGWSVPVFQGQVGTTGPVQSTVQQASISGDIAAGIGGGFKDAVIQGAAGLGSSLIKWTVWGGEFLVGTALIGFAIFLLVKGTVNAAHV